MYPYGVARGEEDGNPFLITTKEKALCDTLSKLEGNVSRDSSQSLLYEDLRMEEDDILSMDVADIEFLAPLYGKQVLMPLLSYLKARVSSPGRKRRRA